MHDAVTLVEAPRPATSKAEMAENAASEPEVAEVEEYAI